MFDEIIRRSDVYNLLIEICNNEKYYCKDTTNALNYEKFIGFTYPLFMAIDALYKYSIIIEDENLIGKYVEEMDLLFKRVSSITGINTGINTLIGKFVGLKLGYKSDYMSKKEEILRYIYNRYISEGYLFHAFSNVYEEDIKTNGFIPQKYNNLYSRFRKANNLVGDIIDNSFNDDKVYFTDSFMMACFYAINSPLYFSNLVSNNKYIKKDYDKLAYYRNDYNDCLKNLNKVCMFLDLGLDDSNNLRDLYRDEWQLLSKSNCYPSIMMVKRKLFFDDNEIDVIVRESEDLIDGIERIFVNKYNNVECRNKVDKSLINIVHFYRYNDLVKKNHHKKIEVNKESGVVSVLLLSGFSLIMLGILLMAIMVRGG